MLAAASPAVIQGDRGGAAAAARAAALLLPSGGYQTRGMTRARRRPLSAIRERARGVAQAISRGDKRRVSGCELPIDKRSVMVAALAEAPRHRCPP